MLEEIAKGAAILVIGGLAYLHDARTEGPVAKEPNERGAAPRPISVCSAFSASLWWSSVASALLLFFAYFDVVTTEVYLVAHNAIGMHITILSSIMPYRLLVTVVSGSRRGAHQSGPMSEKDIVMGVSGCLLFFFAGTCALVGGGVVDGSVTLVVWRGMMTIAMVGQFVTLLSTVVILLTVGAKRRMFAFVGPALFMSVSATLLMWLTWTGVLNVLAGRFALLAVFAGWILAITPGLPVQSRVFGKRFDPSRMTTAGTRRTTAAGPRKTTAVGTKAASKRSARQRPGKSPGDRSPKQPIPSSFVSKDRGDTGGGMSSVPWSALGTSMNKLVLGDESEKAGTARSPTATKPSISITPRSARSPVPPKSPKSPASARTGRRRSLSGLGGIGRPTMARLGRSGSLGALERKKAPGEVADALGPVSRSLQLRRSKTQGTVRMKGELLSLVHEASVEDSDIVTEQSREAWKPALRMGGASTAEEPALVMPGEAVRLSSDRESRNRIAPGSDRLNLRSGSGSDRESHIQLSSGRERPALHRVASNASNSSDALSGPKLAVVIPHSNRKDLHAPWQGSHHSSSSFRLRMQPGSSPGSHASAYEPAIFTGQVDLNDVDRVMIFEPEEFTLADEELTRFVLLS